MAELHACATVVKFLDGDTPIVRRVPDVPRHDGATGEYAIRMIGLNTFETNPEQPHAQEAKEYAQRLAEESGNHVRLFALEEGRTSSRNRHREHIYVYRPGVGWRLLAGLIVRQGLAVAMYRNDEHSENVQIGRAQAKAMRDGLNLWSNPDRRLRLKVTWNVAGSDAGREYADIINVSDETVWMSGWSLRGSEAWDTGDTSHRGYVFAKGTRIPAGKTLRLYVTNGTDSALVKYWGRGDEKPWNNVNEVGGGDTGIVLRPDGTPAAWQTWPEYQV